MNKQKIITVNKDSKLMKEEDLMLVREEIKAGVGDEDPVIVDSSIFELLTIDDLPTEHVEITTGSVSDNDVLTLDWDGVIFREGDRIKVVVRCDEYSKFWWKSLGLQYYMCAFILSVETRQVETGDIKVVDHYNDDGIWISLSYVIDIPEIKNLGEALLYAKQLDRELKRPADELVKKVDEVFKKDIREREKRFWRATDLKEPQSAGEVDA